MSLQVDIHYTNEHNTKLLLDVWVKGEVPGAENEPMAAMPGNSQESVSTLQRPQPQAAACDKTAQPSSLLRHLWWT